MTHALWHTLRCGLCWGLIEILKDLIQTVPTTNEHKLAVLHRLFMQQLSEKDN